MPALPQQIGRYRVIRTLGIGGMGAVYLAHDTQLDRQVAIKIPTFQPQGRQAAIERFYREARLAATLRHANLCPVYDVGEFEGTHYLAMAFIEGRPLSDYVRSDTVIPERAAAAIVRDIALGLDHAHRHGVIHRDLKPGNVMIDREQKPIVMDFGLARRAGTNDDTRVTQPGMVVGTPSYMSPEQVEGDTDAIGPAADIYSLGVLLYELLTARLPFEGSVASVLGQIMSRAPLPPSQHRPNVDPRLEAICLKMIAKSVSDRFGSMDEVATVLDTVLQSGSTPRIPANAPVARIGGESQAKSGLTRRRIVSLPLSPARYAGWTAGAVSAVLLLIVAVLVIRNRDAGVGNNGSAVAEHSSEVGNPSGTADNQASSNGPSGNQIAGSNPPVAVPQAANPTDHATVGSGAGTQATQVDSPVQSGAGSPLPADPSLPGSETSNHLVSNNESTAPAGEIEPLGGSPSTADLSGASSGAPSDAGDELLDSIDLRWDATYGEWTRTPEGWACQAGPEARLMIPITVSGGYRLEVELMRSADAGSIRIMLPVQNQRATFVLAGSPKASSGLELISGKPVDQNPSRVPAANRGGGRERLSIRVVPSAETVSISVRLDGRPYLSWSGPIKNLSEPLPWRLPRYDTFGIGADGLSAIFRSFQLQIDEGSVKSAAPAPQADWSETPGALDCPASTADAVRHQKAWAAKSGKPLEISDSIGQRLMLIPPGRFEMSREFGYEVAITRPFYLGKHEVTVADFQKFAKATSLKFRFDGKQAADHPISRVTPKDIREFCRWLTEKETANYRLPTEAEWEWACRAGNEAPYYFGDQPGILAKHAWFDATSDSQLHPVGKLLSNCWGLCDVYGNAAELVHGDPGDRYPRGRFVDPRPPQDDLFLVRGGTVASKNTECTSAFRRGERVESRSTHPYWGFRVLREVPEAPNGRADQS